MSVVSRSLCLGLLVAPALALAQTPPPPANPAPPPPPAVEPPPPSEPAPAVDQDSVNDEDDTDKSDDTNAPVTYQARRGISIHSGKTRLRFFLGAETVLLYGHCSGDNCEASDLATLHVRRARFAMEAKLKHHLSIDLALQVKNEVIVLKNANFSWKHHHLTLKAGFFKPPGGLERDTSTWVKPFPERSVVANFKQDRIIGLMASKWVAGHTLRLQGAAGRPPTGNFDAFEPEDVVVPPESVEPEDLTTDPGNWDLFATAAYAPSDTFEIGVNTTAHIAPDAGQGPNFSEPYETRIIQPRFIKGAFLAGGLDVSWHSPHLRASAEVVAFKSGDTIPHLDAMGNPLEPSRAERGIAGYAVIGYTPNGAYGPAIENSPLLKGWQWITRGEFLSASPGGIADPDATAGFGSVTTGIEWQVEKQLRLQVDVAVQHYNEAVDPSNYNAWRVYSELWGQVLL
ncbi:MAG TPA: hypothetical protein VFQ53_36205 [Kofleriaceae bacterium]|nr:hypothetical protein [Kofleriaceae bacterium]